MVVDEILEICIPKNRIDFSQNKRILSNSNLNEFSIFSPNDVCLYCAVIDSIKKKNFLNFSSNIRHTIARKKRERRISRMIDAMLQKKSPFFSHFHPFFSLPDRNCTERKRKKYKILSLFFQFIKINLLFLAQN